MLKWVQIPSMLYCIQYPFPKELAARLTSEIQLTPFYLLFLATAVAPKTSSIKGKHDQLLYIYIHICECIHIYLCMYAPGYIYIQNINIYNIFKYLYIVTLNKYLASYLKNISQNYIFTNIQQRPLIDFLWFIYFYYCAAR